MARLLLITNTFTGGSAGGRALLCRLNRDALLAIAGEELRVFELQKAPTRGVGSVLRAFRGEIDGITVASLNQLLSEVSEHGIDTVFVDGSNLGAIARCVKSRLPRVRVISFFHNVEARFFLGSFRQKRSLRSLAVLGANYAAERMAVRHSDKIICLSQRDSVLLRKVYGRGATHVMPMALQDRWSGQAPSDTAHGEKFALFVGGLFYANQEGITWFVDHVVPLITMKSYIVGHGFDALKSRLERNGNVEVVGSVASLAPWYERAHVVIAPIFDGSGMKTKVAEALMFGKRIVGTPEAFSGYEDIVPVAGEVCRSAAEFADSVNRSANAPFRAFDPELRLIYERNYSFEAAVARLRTALAAND